MQRIFNALVQFRNPILYIFLLGFSLLFLSSRSSFHQNTLEKVGFYFSSGLYSFTNSFDEYFHLREKNTQLLEALSNINKILL